MLRTAAGRTGPKASNSIMNSERGGWLQPTFPVLARVHRTTIALEILQTTVSSIVALFFDPWRRRAEDSCSQSETHRRTCTPRSCSRDVCACKEQLSLHFQSHRCRFVSWLMPCKKLNQKNASWPRLPLPECWQNPTHTRRQTERETDREREREIERERERASERASGSIN